MIRVLFSVILSVFLWPASGEAQTVHQELQETVRAEVVAIVAEEERTIMGTGATTTVQTIRARILSGVQEGVVIEFDDDLVLLAPGDKIFINRLMTINGDEYFTLKDVDRRGYLVGLVLLFVSILLWFSGWHGLRALGSLAVSIAAIIFVLVPALLAGYDPALVSLGIASVILAVALFGTHGYTRRARAAFFGTFGAVLASCALAAFFVSVMRLTGFGSDASVYLNFSTGGALDFAGLLLGSIIIGMLGVLDDVSITQASVVEELKIANPRLGFGELYQRAVRVGRDHIGSLVNTLALAYVGVSLPLVLLFARADSTLSLTLNQEVVAAELVRIMVGSIGLILAVPLTTAIAAWWCSRVIVDEVTSSSPSHNHLH